MTGLAKGCWKGKVGEVYDQRTADENS
jgi:hypothetical protein